jgi:superfamily II DNA helicase RecQ
MALQCKFFIIPVGDIEHSEVEVNRFLRSVRVVNMQRDFVDQGPNSFWSVAVEYLSAAKSAGEKNRLKKSKIDYKQVLSPEDFALFAQLREWRKGEAAEIGVPVYTIFTNEQLAKIAEQKIHTKPGKGLPIGNLISQHLANFYLGIYDHWIKEKRRLRG